MGSPCSWFVSVPESRHFISHLGSLYCFLFCFGYLLCCFLCYLLCYSMLFVLMLSGTEFFDCANGLKVIVI